MALRVALTFDTEHPDRPRNAPDGCAGVLHALAAAGVPATFFVQGRWALSHPTEARRIAAEGHLVGLHCHSHVAYPRLSPAGVAADLAEGREAVTGACGVDPAPWFRLPYGAGADDPALLSLVRYQGFTHVDWTADSRDWCDCVRADGLAEAMLAAAGRADGLAVLVHHSWPVTTAAALPAIIDGLRAIDAEFVTVDKLDAAELAALHLSPDYHGKGACTCAEEDAAA
jgi:peptidoglycan/xylan/chitin deacetylase (PgdA/CDA1 family)